MADGLALGSVWHRNTCAVLIRTGEPPIPLDFLGLGRYAKNTTIPITFSCLGRYAKNTTIPIHFPGLGRYVKNPQGNKNQGR